MEEQICKKIESTEHQAILMGILLGKSDKIDDEIKSYFTGSSLSHILAVSGMHIGYIISIVNYILSKMKMGKKNTKIFTIALLIFFMELANNTPSVRRACIMAILGIVAVLINQKSDIINNMAISLFIILFQNPFSIFNKGLILSYGATLGIILFSKIFLKTKENFEKENKTSIIDKIKNIVLISIFVQISILPINIYFFQSVSTVFIFSNILVSGIIGIIIVLGFIICVPINIPILPTILDFFVSILVEICKIFATFPIARITVSPPSIFVIALYYIALFFFIYIKLLRKKELKRRIEKVLLTNVDKFKCFIFKRKIAVIVVLCVITICFQIIKNLPQDLQISFIDVGQGDCTLITTPNHKNILIDGGGSTKSDTYDVGEKVVYPYLISHNIHKIDMIVISHFDADHCNGFVYLLENIEVKKIVIGMQVEESTEYTNIISIANEKNIAVYIVKKAEKIVIDTNLYFDVLYPKSNKEQEGLNNNSLVLKLNYGEFSMLFTGDIEKETEAILVNEYTNTNMLKSTVLKVAHHGSKTSSTEEFLKLVEPQIALIGVGEDNKYGHPNTNVLERLQNINCKIYRTDENGEVRLWVNNNGNIKIRSMYK
jgi:competence protein ComEC